MPEWSRVANTTIHKFIREVEDNVMRDRKLLAKLKAKGRLSFNWSGDLADWKVKYKRIPMQGYADSDVLTFSRRDEFKTAQLEWRGYAATNAMTEKERLMNRNVEAIIKYYSTIAESMMDSCTDQLADELYVDGAAAGNSKRWHGTETMFAGATASSSGNSPVGVNAATYAGLSTVLGNAGGSWTGSWPTGSGDAHYDFFTPLIVDYTSAITTANGGWAASTKTWPNTCIEALRYGIIKSRKNRSAKGQLDLILLEGELYRQYLNALEAEQRITITRNQKGGLYELGFGDMVSFEGVDISYEFGVPSNVGYGWATGETEIRCLNDGIFTPVGPDKDLSTMTYRFAILNFGNMCFNPRYMLKLIALGGT